DSARLEQATGDVAAPAMGFQSAARRQGFLLFTTQGTRLGNTGLTVERMAEGRHARFLLTAPCVREFRQDHCRAVPSDDRAVTWNTGESLKLRLRVCFFAAPELQRLFDRFCELRKGLNPSEPANELPFSAAWKMLEEKYHRDNWDENSGYFKLAPNSNSTAEMKENPL